MNELMSIVVPVYRAERYIRDTLDSVRNQTYTKWELLLVADGEEDPTIPVIQQYVEEKKEERIRLLIQKENRGIYRKTECCTPRVQSSTPRTD